MVAQLQFTKITELTYNGWILWYGNCTLIELIPKSSGNSKGLSTFYSQVKSLKISKQINSRELQYSYYCRTQLIKTSIDHYSIEWLPTEHIHSRTHMHTHAHTAYHSWRSHIELLGPVKCLKWKLEMQPSSSLVCLPLTTKSF